MHNTSCVLTCESLILICVVWKTYTDVSENPIATVVYLEDGATGSL